MKPVIQRRRGRLSRRLEFPQENIYKYAYDKSNKFRHHSYTSYTSISRPPHVYYIWFALGIHSQNAERTCVHACCVDLFRTIIVVVFVFSKRLPTMIKHVVFGSFGGRGGGSPTTIHYNAVTPPDLLLSVSVNKLLWQNTSSIVFSSE